MMKRKGNPALSMVAPMTLAMVLSAALATRGAVFEEGALEELVDNAPPRITVPTNLFLRDALVGLKLAATVSDDGYPLPADVVQPSPDDPHRLRATAPSNSDIRPNSNASATANSNWAK